MLDRDLQSRVAEGAPQPGSLRPPRQQGEDQKPTLVRDPPHRQPDLWIQHSGVWLGDDTYNTDGADQTSTRTAGPGTTALYRARLYNDGDDPGDFWIRGPMGTDNWIVRYYRGSKVDPDREVTDQVVSPKGWKRAHVPPGGVRYFCFTVTSGPSTHRQCDVPVEIMSALGPSESDTIQACTLIPEVQPDLWLKAGPAWKGDDIYNDDGTDQFRRQTVDTETSAVYRAQLQNDGDTPATFFIKGPAGNTNWTVDYYWGTAVREDRKVTTQVTREKGWRRGNIPPGEGRKFLITVAPGSELPAGSRYVALVRVESSKDPTLRDTLKTITRVKAE